MCMPKPKMPAPPPPPAPPPAAPAAAPSAVDFEATSTASAALKKGKFGKSKFKNKKTYQNTLGTNFGGKGQGLSIPTKKV